MGRGDACRFAKCGGGVIDDARGVWDVDGDGEAAGDECSIEGLVTRLPPETVVPLKADLEVSSSEVAPLSTSLRSDERKEGPAPPLDCCR
jgi:hypothetical protein